ncbi:MAG: hypothetical protein IPN54_14265 [Bacteroidetes bacterium]|nr:hypothetical protein [Bacteroidota bacterium]MBK9425271.1 hypothetical protein [Bacteroidota bacterium]
MADWVGVTIQFLSLIITIATWYVAYKLSKKFGVGQKRVEKQYEIVLDLINLINNQGIRIQNENISYYYKLENFSKSNFLDSESVKNLIQVKQFYYDSGFFSGLTFNKCNGNQLVPKKISDAIKKFQPTDGKMVHMNNFNYVEEFMTITIKETNILNETFFWMPNNSFHYNNFLNFYKGILELMKAINEWLKSVEAKEFEFRFDEKLK